MYSSFFIQRANECALCSDIVPYKRSGTVTYCLICSNPPFRLQCGYHNIEFMKPRVGGCMYLRVMSRTEYCGAQDGVLKEGVY